MKRLFMKNDLCDVDISPELEMDEDQELYEICVLCGSRTDIPKETPIHLRPGYVEGAGQLCMQCARILDRMI